MLGWCWHTVACSLPHRIPTQMRVCHERGFDVKANSLVCSLVSYEKQRNAVLRLRGLSCLGGALRLTQWPVFIIPRTSPSKQHKRMNTLKYPSPWLLRKIRPGLPDLHYTRPSGLQLWLSSSEGSSRRGSSLEHSFPKSSVRLLAV